MPTNKSVILNELNNLNQEALALLGLTYKPEDTAKVLSEVLAKAKAGLFRDHVVTDEDLANNPELVNSEVAVGDTVQLPLTLEEIKESLPKAPEKKDESSKPEDVKPAKVKKDTSVSTVIKIGEDGQELVIREYSEEVHGEDHAELAKQFAEKNSDKGYQVK